MKPTVYIMASGQQGTLYVGVTSNLVQRVWPHRQGAIEGYPQIQAESSGLLCSACIHGRRDHSRKTDKKWRRQWTLNLIQTQNPACTTCGRRLSECRFH